MPRSQRWTPGFRPTNNRKKTGNVKKLLLANMHTSTVSVTEGTKDDSFVESESLSGITPEVAEPDVIMSLFKGQNLFSVNLTNLREDELLAMKEAIDYAFEHALPIVQKRDKVAREARESGDNTYRRLHRGTPQVSYLRGPRGQHTEELHE